MFILPSRGRPDKLHRFITHSKPVEQFLVMLDVDDADNYNGVNFPSNMIVVISPRATAGELINKAFTMMPNEPWYGLAADDILPDAGWDSELAKLITPDDIIWPRDGVHDRCSHPLIGGNLARKAGWLVPEGFKHFYVDNVWQEIAYRLDCTGLIGHININHMHFTVGKSEKDETYKSRPSVTADASRFNRFMNGEIDDVCNRLR